MALEHSNAIYEMTETLENDWLAMECILYRMRKALLLPDASERRGISVRTDRPSENHY